MRKIEYFDYQKVAKDMKMPAPILKKMEEGWSLPDLSAMVLDLKDSSFYVG
jgi:hypothetical protein